MVEQKLKKVFWLLVLVPNDTLSKALVDVKSLFSSDWVLANKGMLEAVGWVSGNRHAGDG